VHEVLGLFAESGKVHYVDTKEEGSGNSTWKDHVDAGSKGSLTVKGNSTASGGTTNAQQSKSKTATTTFQTSTTWKYTTPVVTATVVSGNGEVSDQTFTESGAGGADAAKAKTTDKQ
jgi:hypothetical protein